LTLPRWGTGLLGGGHQLGTLGGPVMPDLEALRDGHVLKPLEDRLLRMCDDMHPATRVLMGNAVAALRVFAKEHPNLREDTEHGR